MKAALLTLALFALLYATKAPAHGDWYSDFPQCCSGHDCRAAERDEIVMAPGGWRVVPTGEFYAQAKVRMSPDGKFHRCLRVPTDITSPTICLFVPDSGS
jgi:hypothetical protein